MDWFSIAKRLNMVILLHNELERYSTFLLFPKNALMFVLIYF